MATATLYRKLKIETETLVRKTRNMSPLLSSRITHAPAGGERQRPQVGAGGAHQHAGANARPHIPSIICGQRGKGSRGIWWPGTHPPPHPTTSSHTLGQTVNVCIDTKCDAMSPHRLSTSRPAQVAAVLVARPCCPHDVASRIHVVKREAMAGERSRGRVSCVHRFS